MKILTQNQYNLSKFSKIASYDAYLRLFKFVNNQQAQIPEIGRLDVKAYFRTMPGRFYYSKLLTKIIKKLLTAAGWMVQEPHDTGRMIKGKNGKQVWVKTKLTRKGQADIQAIGPGLYWEIEIKIDDRQSDVQKLNQERLTKLGHKYTICRTVDDFFSQFESIHVKSK